MQGFAVHVQVLGSLPITPIIVFYDNRIAWEGPACAAML